MIVGSTSSAAGVSAAGASSVLTPSLMVFSISSYVGEAVGTYTMVALFSISA